MQSSSVYRNTMTSKLWKQFLRLSMFLGLIFSAANSSNASEHFSNHLSIDILTGDDTFLASCQDQYLYQSPFDSNLPDSIPDQREESDQEENLEKEESSDNDRVAVSKLSVCLQQRIFEIQSVQYYQSVQNRKTIPLFILFQNWKSFLT